MPWLHWVVPSSPALIVVVDDDPHVCKALARLLRSFGFIVETHASGGAFLQTVRDHRPDCVVLDLHMPGLSGLEVQSQLAGWGIATPVVIITGQETQEARAHALRNGAVAFICKPIDATVLLTAVNGALLTSG